MIKSALFVTLMLITGAASAEIVGTATSVDGHQVRLTTERCTSGSGRAEDLRWGRTYSWSNLGLTATGCGRLDNDTVLIEWLVRPGTVDTRRYSVDNFAWKPGFGK